MLGIDGNGVDPGCCSRHTSVKPHNRGHRNCTNNFAIIMVRQAIISSQAREPYR